MRYPSFFRNNIFIRKVFLPIFRFLSPLIWILLRTYWFVFRPVTTGVRCLIECDGTFLLVKSTGMDQWTIPGGGVKSQEAFEVAIRREALEETGLTLGEVAYLGSREHRAEYKKDTVHYFYSVVRNPQVEIGDILEIEKMGWFRPLDFPENTAEMVSWAVEKSRMI